ncbi:MFS transporter [Bosea caraganae]|uniref:MFS transporter n=1 Tax=Bosea caraganae TaxID=2763117 RepID=A0A370LCN6_9HYPH|nr:MFS transporter [Bosea caraganae]RDJ27605.1 MFS transporter [Bosea caraganae]RDJ29619.1 MFS transporter [Bosea caraganae]
MHARALTGREQAGSIAAAILLAGMVGLGLSLTLPLLSIEMERMGVSGTVIGLNTAIAGLASILIIPFVPRIAARVGIGRLLALSILLTGLSFLGFRLFFDLLAWFPIRFLFSAALGTLFVLSEYWIAASAPPERRGLVMGVYATVLALGFSAGPALLGLFGTSGWPPYLAGGLIFLLAGLPLAFARHLLPRLDAGSGHSLLGYLTALPMATAAGAGFGAVEAGGFALLPVYGMRHGLDAETAALLISAVALGNVALQVPIGLLADRVSKSRLLLAIALLGLAGTFAIPLAQQAGPWPLYAVLFLWGGIVGGLYTVGLAHLAARFTGRDLAGANAAFLLLYNVGLMLGPPIIGLGLDWSMRWGLSLSVALFLLPLLAAASARRD